jgi:hypothetical protein
LIGFFRIIGNVTYFRITICRIISLHWQDKN